MSVKLENLFQIVGTLIEAAPDGGPEQATVEALPKPSQVLGHGNEAFGGRACRVTRRLMGLVHIRTVAHEDISHVLVVELAVFGTAKAQIRDGAAWIGPHARSKAFQR